MLKVKSLILGAVIPVSLFAASVADAMPYGKYR